MHINHTHHDRTTRVKRLYAEHAHSSPCLTQVASSTLRLQQATD